MEKRFCDKCKKEIDTHIKGVYSIQLARYNGDTSITIGGHGKETDEAEKKGINTICTSGELCLDCLKRLLSWIEHAKL